MSRLSRIMASIGAGLASKGISLAPPGSLGPMVYDPDNRTVKPDDLDRNGRKGRMKNKLCVCGSGKKFKKCCWGDFA